MPKRSLVSFFTIFFTLYGIINFYIFIHGFNVLSGSIRITYSLLYLIFSVSFFIGRYLEKRSISIFCDVFVWIGSLWFAAMLYFFLFVLLTDIILIINAILGFIPPGSQFFMYEFYFVFASVTIIVFAGYLNAKNVRVKDLHIKITRKHNAKPRHYRIASVSDIHLGTIIGAKRLGNIVNKINAINPDVVLLPGDVLDEDVTPVIRQNLGELLKAIKSKFGVYSVTGNHEYIGGINKAVKYLTEHNIDILRDESILIDNNFYLVGREDRAIRSFAGKDRKSLEEIMKNVDTSKPVILMDHQPYDLEEAQHNGVDLQLSGHTHHAQLWPLNFITKKIYEVSWGYKKKGDTHVYVSCGAGTWGPPVRLGNTPEIMNIDFEIA